MCVFFFGVNVLININFWLESSSLSKSEINSFQFLSVYYFPKKLPQMALNAI